MASEATRPTGHVARCQFTTGYAGGRSKLALGSMVAVGFYADLHIHSKYSRATSCDCDLERLSWWAQRKGIGVVATDSRIQARRAQTLLKCG